ncbi:MAG: hypothetical protein QGH73_04160 [Rhodospirillales bacterium]|jgi:hypothetical protein|nr:hypothetical protein [Rhodospirillaceae bacterium]MDP6429482.1 hypothetical protein [Rhodospirillales bacterium]MDP6643695.1 hypothetical protein [Rhodospirillales bacterium]MDP6840849.1 hypothetical protein [Rhodospirillales bacterium]|tara:strand:- start:2844 stop:3074 length:231 start_codon:yes stop_codon:yes gene_type:complete
MFGFSPLKILVLIAIIVVVWYGFKKFTRGGQVGGGGTRKQAGGKSSGALEMTECEVCGDYVAANVKDCGRDGCPYG